MEINNNVTHLDDRVQWEFKCIEKYLTGNGVDVGCGTNGLSKEIPAIDNQPDQRYAHTDVVHDCKDLEIDRPLEFNGYTYTFEDNSLDYIFSSHCLEDFDNIPQVFMNWWKKIKLNGLMILLLPDMEGGRYPKVGDLGGNPSHKTDVGENYIKNMLEELDIKYEVIQCDTLPHNKTCTIDFVIKKL